MSKIDRIKEQLAWLKIRYGALLVLDASIIGWLAQNYSSANQVLVIMIVIATGVITVAIVWTDRIAKKLLKQLEDIL